MYFHVQHGSKNRHMLTEYKSSVSQKSLEIKFIFFRWATRACGGVILGLIFSTFDWSQAKYAQFMRQVSKTKNKNTVCMYIL
jgi:hypothetical protein